MVCSRAEQQFWFDHQQAFFSIEGLENIRDCVPVLSSWDGTVSSQFDKSREKDFHDFHGVIAS